LRDCLGLHRLDLRLGRLRVRAAPRCGRMDSVLFR
jgi:hypothetical protein